jgi:hypothetical protein
MAFGAAPMGMNFAAQAMQMQGKLRSVGGGAKGPATPAAPAQSNSNSGEDWKARLKERRKRTLTTEESDMVSAIH